MKDRKMNLFGDLLSTQSKKIRDILIAKKSDALIFNVGMVVAFLIYFPLILKEQIFSDEYDLLGSGNSLAEHIKKDGRPAGAMVYKIMALIVDAPQDLFILRLTSLISAIVLLKMLSRKFQKIENSKMHQAILVSSIFLPTFVLYIFWGMLSYFMIAVTLSFISFELWSSEENRKRILAVIIQITAILVYPPSAFTTFALMGVLYLFSSESISESVRNIGKWIIFTCISGVIAISIVLLDTKLNDFSLNTRVKTVQLNDLPEKIIWIFTRPFLISTRLFDIRSPSSFEALFSFTIFALVLFAGLKIRFVHAKLILVKVILFLTTILLSLAPIILSSDNQFDYRLILGPSISMFLALGFCLIEIAKVIDSKSRLGIALLLSVFTFGVFSMHSHSSKLFLEPYEIKMKLISDSVKVCFEENRSPQSISIIGKNQVFDQRKNLGLFSMKTDLASSWVPIPSFEWAIFENHFPELPVRFLESDSYIPPESCSIDFAAFAESFKNRDP
jgi:hypothetical protein